MNGVLNIYKEAGFTSHDVVAKLRGIVKQKKIGHTGTLDPDAEGVLPVCLGNATRLCGLLTDKEKTYEAVLLLGQTTDTYDTSGTVLTTAPVTCSEQEAREAVLSFVGPCQQIPPMYSARKVNGKKLYELAREGKVIEREARTVQIHEITIQSVSLPEVAFTVTCSSGTYIRTLCQDIGEKLGCGGCMKKLTRTRVDRFTLQEAKRLSEVEALMQEGRIEEILLPTDAMFADCPALHSTAPDGDRLVHNGNPLPSALSAETMDGDRLAHNGSPLLSTLSAETPALDEGARVRLYDSKEQFIGLYRYESKKKLYRPEKMFIT